MIYIDECIDQTVQYLKAPKQNLKRCVYNMGGISFSPEQLISEVQKLIPGFTAEYDLCPVRSKIADTWPRKLDDSLANQEWGMTYDATLYDLAHKILSGIDPQYKEGKVLNMGGSPITESKQTSSKQL
jgi:nucleoside-diphosphate-sugar epimerase